jgi:hypothetical protein
LNNYNKKEVDMPEILTKHPEIVIEILNKSKVAVCGKGKPQKILKQCPRESFCSLPGGELCVYGLSQFSEMTQFSRADVCTEAQSRSTASVSSSAFSGLLLCVIVGLFLKKQH